jgi:hypothetical protein
MEKRSVSATTHAASQGNQSPTGRFQCLARIEPFRAHASFAEQDDRDITDTGPVGQGVEGAQRRDLTNMRATAPRGEEICGSCDSAFRKEARRAADMAEVSVTVASTKSRTGPCNTVPSHTSNRN